MPADETTRSVVEFSAATDSTGFDQVLAYLKKIEEAASSLDRMWRSVVQTMSETGYIRVLGITELREGISGVRSEINALRADFASGTASMNVTAESAATAASKLAELEGTLAALRIREQELVQAQAAVAQTSLMPLFSDYIEGGKEAAQALGLTVESLRELSSTALQPWTQPMGLAGMGGGRTQPTFEFGPAEMAAIGFYEAVEAGNATIATATDALRYLQGQMTLYSATAQTGGAAAKEVGQQVREYAANQIELNRLVSQAAGLERQITAVRATSEGQLSQQADALQETLQQLQNLPAAIRDVMVSTQQGVEVQVQAGQQQQEAAQGAAQAVQQVATAQTQATSATQAHTQAMQRQTTTAREINAVMALRAELRPGQAVSAAAAPVMPEIWDLREELQAGGRSQAWMWEQMTEAEQAHIASIHAHGQALAAQAVGLDDVSGAQARLADATQETTQIQDVAGQSTQKQTGLLSGFRREFQTHLRWMVRYIILWKGMQLVIGGIKEWYRVNAQLDRSLTLLSTSLGGNVALLREYRDAMLAAAEAGRVLPTEMAPAAVMTGRIYDPEQAEAMMTTAAELAFVSGAKVEDVTRRLIVLQRQLGLGSAEMASVMDALAGSLRNTHLSYADLLPMLDRAVVYSRRYNMSVEETIGLQAGVASATGATGGELDSFMRRLTDIYRVGSTANETLRNLGITTVAVGESGEQIRMPLIAVFEAIERAVEGDEAALERVSKSMFRVGSANRAVFEAAIRNGPLVRQSYYDAIQAAGQWNRTVSEMEDTWEAATAHMKGGWQELLVALKWDDAIAGAINVLGDAMHRLADWVAVVEENWESLGQTVGKPLNWLLGREVFTTPPVVPERGVETGSPFDYPQLPPGGVGGPQLPSALDVRTATLEVPEGANFDDVITSYEKIVDRWIGTFQDQQGNYYRITEGQIDAARSLALVWDATAGEFRILNAFMPALQEAIQENTAALKSPSLRFMPFDPVQNATALQRLITYYERVASNLGFVDEPQAQVLWGPDDSILQLTTSNTVLQMVMHALTEAIEENTEAMNEGMWNIPEGVSALVPITSLFYQNLQKPGDKWANADLAAIIDKILGAGAALAPAGVPGGIGGRGGRISGVAGGEGAVPPGAYDYYMPGYSPYTPAGEAGGAGPARTPFESYAPGLSSLAEVGTDLSQSSRGLDMAGAHLDQSAVIVAQSGYALTRAARRVGGRGYNPYRDDTYPPDVPWGDIPSGNGGRYGGGGTGGGGGGPTEASFHITLMLNESVLAEVTRKAIAEVL